MKNKFVAWDWDEGRFISIPTNNIVDAIHYAWNYEFNVYENTSGDKELIFSGYEDNETNSEMLSKYGLRLIDSDDGYRNLQNVETGEIYKPEWQ